MHGGFVDPVLPPPHQASDALWERLTGGKLGHDFFRTFERTLRSTMIAAVVAIPPDRAGQDTCRRRVSVIHSGDFRLPCTAAMQSNGA